MTFGLASGSGWDSTLLPGQTTRRAAVAPHEFVDPEADCCGCLYAVPHANLTDLMCYECDAVVRTVPPAEVQQTLLQMAMSRGVKRQAIQTH